jgi:L-asparagine permease
MSSTVSKASPDPATHHRNWLDSHEQGYEKSLKPRQIQMIAIGGAIGTGLFLGAGGRLQLAGPALALVYLFCGFFSFLILRALGELVMYRPTSGSFVSYAREFLGERGSFVAGWLYYLNWAMTGIVDITAVALYMKYWGTFGDVPQWVFALVALAFVGALNMVAVKWFYLDRLPVRRRAELRRSQPGVRDRFEHRVTGYRQHLGIHCCLPNDAAATDR